MKMARVAVFVPIGLLLAAGAGLGDGKTSSISDNGAKLLDVGIPNS